MNFCDTVLYLHGFSSAGASAKAARLRTLLDPIALLSPSYPSHSPHDAVVFLEAVIRQTFAGRPPCIIGSSLGGYYAQYFASVYKHAAIVLINPALQPQLTLKPFVGDNINVVTGEAFEFSAGDLAALSHFDVMHAPAEGRCLVLLDEGDELIDAHYAANKYRESARVRLFPGGNHGFTHLDEALPDIKRLFQISLRML